MPSNRPPAATYNLSELFESIVDAVDEDRVAMVVGDQRRLTYRQLDERADRLADHLHRHGVGPGDRVGAQLLNGTEYIETMVAAFKLAAVPVNVNYRYVADELAHIYRDAGLTALVHNRSFGARVAEVAPTIPGLDVILVVDDDDPASVEAPLAPGTVAYEDALAAATPNRPAVARSSDDLYVVYTGGTTGLPKGVMWRNEDIFFGAIGGGDILQSGDFVSEPAELASRVSEFGMATLTTPPFMHASAHWGAFMGLLAGGKIVVVPYGRFDPAQIWRLIETEAVNVAVIVGDAMASPLLDEWDRSGPYDLSSLIVIGSGGAVLSPASKERLASLREGLMIVDGIGSSELGTVGTKATTADQQATGPVFTVNAQTAVLDEDLRRIEPGSEQVGQLARSGHIPLGYWGDPDKTAATFVTDADGTRWALAGDMATVAADGSVELLGRGSVSINTGGEKVYPEEVEVAVRDHPAVADVLVVGVPDDRWGQQVTAVVALRPDHADRADDPEGLAAEIGLRCRAKLAGYKVPKAVVICEEVVRSPAGKADYRWAAGYAAERLAAS